MNIFKITLLSICAISAPAYSMVTVDDVVEASRNYHAKQAILAAMPEFTQDYETAKREYTQAFKCYAGEFAPLQEKIEAAIGKKSAKKLAEWNRKKIAAEQPNVSADCVVEKALAYEAKFKAIEPTTAYQEYRDAKKAYKPTFGAYIKAHPGETSEHMITIFTEQLGKKEAKKLSKWFKKLARIVAAA